MSLPMSTEDMRQNIRSMLAAMDMSYKEAGEEFGVNPSSLGAMLTEKKVPPLHAAVETKYKEYLDQKS